MTFNILFAGVGGLGVMVTSVVVAKAAHLDGYKVGGVQVHGLAQRGGSIPIQVRISKEEVYSPVIPKGKADLIFGLELIEGLRYVELADKERTNFLIDTYSIKPTNLKAQREYPSLEEVKRKAELLAKKAIFVEAGEICKERFGDIVFGNIMLLGIAIKEGLLPLSQKAIIQALEMTIPRDTKKNIEAFKLGLNYSTKKNSSEKR